MSWILIYMLDVLYSFRQKAKFMKSIAQTLSAPPHNGKVPNSLEELVRSSSCAVFSNPIEFGRGLNPAKMSANTSSDSSVLGCSCLIDDPVNDRQFKLVIWIIAGISFLRKHGVWHREA